ncbi:MAG: DUF1549 domain-containing protein, partial [Limisphaerales bacterium]
MPKRARRLSAGLIVLGFSWAAALGASGVEPGIGGVSEGTDFFRRKVEPLLRDHCFECHSHESGKMKGGLALDSRSGWSEGGSHGPALVPGDPDRSRLIQAIRRADAETAMPPKSPLPSEAVAILEAWVRSGAPDPRILPATAEPGEPAGRWALQPLVRTAVPESGPRHPIDAWIASAGMAMGEPLSGAEGRRILLRRLMVDLHGLLPTPEEVDAFVASDLSDADAFEREVDRLLESPRYGERWARHWLDVAHFAETHGHDQDRPRDNAWPYRDYLIAAFNDDKPYARFVSEQVAADALYPGDPGLTPALGFLAAGPWDESSLRDIREDVVDREVGRYLDRDDIVANVMSTFASVTVHCARCHDHKFDPIPQADYYALQAVFAGTEKAERLYDLDPEVHAKRQAWLAMEVALDRRDFEALEGLMTLELREEQAAWERALATQPTEWRVLDPKEWASDVPVAADARDAALPDGDPVEGTSPAAGLRKLDDASLLAVGTAPATNVYWVSLTVPESGVTAIRLEVLPDDSLPAKGPGRAENGNFHLTGFEAWSRAAGSGDGPFHRVELTQPSADFNQEGWDIGKALDGKPLTGWGIHPEEGKPHVAVFELSREGALKAGDPLRVVLRQQHGRGHTIGRFRLAVTTDRPPLRASPVPEAVRLALAVEPARRSAEERFNVAAHFLAGRVARELSNLPEPKRVYAGASLFPANGGQKPLGRPREVRVLRRGEIGKPME